MIKIKKIIFLVLLSLICIEKGSTEINDSLFMTIGNKPITKSDIVNEIKIIVDDPISGIESDEASFDLLFNDTPIFFDYQPIKKEISYPFNQPLTAGQHKIEFKVRDRMGNESAETIYFVVY